MQINGGRAGFIRCVTNAKLLTSEKGIGQTLKRVGVLMLLISVLGGNASAARRRKGTLIATTYDLELQAPATLPTVHSGVFFTTSLLATGGTGSYTWSVLGKLPAGLSMSNGVISGTTTQIGSFAFSVVLSDSDGHGVTVQRILKVQ